MRPPVDLDGTGGGRPPGEPVDHPGPSGRAEARPQVGVVQGPADRGGQRRGVARRYEQGASRRPRPATSGSAPPVVATTGVAHAIASMSGSEKPSNSDGTTTSSALRRWCTSSSSLTRPVNRTASVQRPAFDRLGHRSAGPGRADHDQLDRAFGAHLGDRLDQRQQALERHVGAGGRDHPAGDPGDGRVGEERVDVDPDRDHVDPPGRDAEVVGDLVAGRLGDRDDVLQPAGHPPLGAGESVPAPQRQPAQAPGRLRAPARGRSAPGGAPWSPAAGPAAAARTRGSGCRARRRSVHAGARSSRRARSANVIGSGKPAVIMVATSSTSTQSRYSPRRGMRNGSGSRYRSRLGTSTRVRPSSSTG